MTRTQLALGPILLLTLLGLALGVACWPDPRPTRPTPAPVVTLVIVQPADPTNTPFAFASPDIFTSPDPTPTYVPERLPVVPAPTATSMPSPTETPVPPTVPPTPEAPRVIHQRG